MNLGAFGTFSPLNILSAPTFFPLLGQPYFGLKTLQETAQLQITANKRKKNMVLPCFMDTELKRFKPTNIFQKMQLAGQIIDETLKNDDVWSHSLRSLAPDALTLVPSPEGEGCLISDILDHQYQRSKNITDILTQQISGLKDNSYKACIKF
ncbi:MAG: hypothetical protein JST75_14480 [Bacteroidetes bacterium]|nr:hypothetical protein [Bacteroidota bacterium]